MENSETVENLPLLEYAEAPEPVEEIQPADQQTKKKVFKTRRLPPLLRLTRRTNVFLFLTLLATGIFFITGNKQIFLESNQALILKIIACNSIALAIFSALATAECIFYLIKDKKIKLLFHIPCYIAIFLLSLITSILSLTINLLSEGFSF